MPTPSPHARWKLRREQILLFAGLALILSQVVLEATGLPWSYQFVLAGLALCGVAVTTWGTR